MSNKVKKDILKLEEELLNVDFMRLKWAKNDGEYIEFKEICDRKIKKLEKMKYDNIMEIISFYNGVILESIKNRYEKGGNLNTILPAWLARKVSSTYKEKVPFYYSFTDTKGVIWNIILDWLPSDGEGCMVYVGYITALQQNRTMHYKMANAEEFFRSTAIEFKRVS